jgi:hypothetical protein
VLRNAEAIAIDNARINRISERTEGLEKSDQHGTVVPRRKVRDVLYQDRARLQLLDDTHERCPQSRPRIVLPARSCANKFSKSTRARAAERLARYAADHQIGRVDSPSAQVFKEVRRVP